MASSPTVEFATERVARESYGKLVAFLASHNRDLAGAEDALAEAFETALRQWPKTGTPENPEAWLMTVARRKQIDLARRRKSAKLAEPHVLMLAEDLAATETEPVPIPDRRLALMFACAHPAIDPAARTPLILQTILGFDAARIASSFLVSPATMSQRLVRAKTKIRTAGIPFQIPEPQALAERLDAVLDAIYACFCDGWADATGSEPERRELSSEAIWLGQLVTRLLPDEPEALSLLALMFYSESRRATRRDVAGQYVPLSEQDPASWDLKLIDRADGLLIEAGRKESLGRFQLQAAIQSVHAARLRAGRTDWIAIEQLYNALFAITGSTVVAVNRAVAIAEARGPHEGLDALNKVGADRQMLDYQPYWAARARLLVNCGDVIGADEAFTIAAGLTSDPAMREFLQNQRLSLRH
jgi:RNA polymerase sigma-70 factor (ECF subfamily)